MYKQIIRPILFSFDPEKIHHFTFSMVKMMHKIPFLPKLIRNKYVIEDERLERKLFGLTFKNPVGLSAGFDKNAVLYNELANFGFGNNEGLEKAIEQLKKNKGKVIIGGNIGKNTATSPENYTEDYLTCFKGLHPYVDYFVLNVSCPNVSSHAKLEDVGYLKELITEVQKVNNKFEKQRPILLKIAPDLNETQLDEIINLIAETKIDGVIATNTSVDRSYQILGR